MGGAIKIVYRSETGAVQANTYWTNVFPDWMHCPKFIARDEEHIRSYIDRDDDLYGGNYTLSPDGYGIIVIDRVNMVILESNGYSTPGETISAHIHLMFRNSEQQAAISTFFHEGTVEEIAAYRLETKNAIEEENGDWLQLLHEGRLTAFDPVRPDKGRMPLPTNGTMQEALARVTEFAGDDRFAMIAIDLSPWRVESFFEDQSGKKALRERMKELGFDMTKSKQFKRFA